MGGEGEDGGAREGERGQVGPTSRVEEEEEEEGAAAADAASAVAVEGRRGGAATEGKRRWRGLSARGAEAAGVS